MKVLDQGYINLVQHMGNDKSVVNAARQSYGKDDWAQPEGEVLEKDAKLINYLMKNRHSTPFEAVTFTFEVKAPIFVFRQWHRHRTFSYNELSARYAELPADFYVPEPSHIGGQSVSSKQARVFAELTKEEQEKRVEEIGNYTSFCRLGFKMYDKFLEDGWPKELARMVLPVSTYSRMSTTGNLHNFFHFLRLRLHPHAQYEIRQYAKAMLKLIYDVVPLSTDAFLATLDADTQTEVSTC